MTHPTGFRPAQPRLIQVKRITDLSPHLRCITFHSDTLPDYPAVGRHAAHIKLFLARPGQKAPTLPTLGERGPQWPEVEVRPVVHTYAIFIHSGKNWAKWMLPLPCTTTAGPPSRLPATRSPETA